MKEACLDRGARRRNVAACQGSALMVALMLVMVLSAAGAVLAALALTELRIAAAYRDGETGVAAARAALQIGLLVVARAGSLSALLDGTEETGLVGSPVVVSPADASRRIDLRLETARVQAQSDAEAEWGADDPQWRLVAAGPLAGLLGLPPELSSHFVGIWAADDPEDADDEPLRDMNGRVWVRAQAYGGGASLSGVEAAVERRIEWGGRVRVLWTREVGAH